MTGVKITGLVAAAALVALAGATTANAQGGGAKRFAPGQGSTMNTGRTTAPGQQMLNNRTRATAPGNSFNAPGQRMIRQRTPGGTR